MKTKTMKRPICISSQQIETLYRLGEKFEVGLFAVHSLAFGDDSDPLIGVEEIAEHGSDSEWVIDRHGKVTSGPSK